MQTHDPFIAEDLRQMELATRYNAWLYSLVRPFLGRRILEVGPGIGNLTRYFVEQADFVAGVEPNPLCAQLLQQAFGASPRFSLHQERVERCDRRALAAGNFDTVVCVNVLEHIEDDLGALRDFRRILAPGGRVVLLVPAMQWAYGPIDRALGHFRRYHRRGLESLLEQSGFDAVSSHYSNAIGLAGWAFNARVRKATKQNDAQIKLFDALVPAISRLEHIVRPPAGLSLVAAGRR